MNYIPTKPLKKKYREAFPWQQSFSENGKHTNKKISPVQAAPCYLPGCLKKAFKTEFQPQAPAIHLWACSLMPCWSHPPSLVQENLATPITLAKRWRLRERKWLTQAHTGCDAFRFSTIQEPARWLGATCWGTPVKFLVLCGPWFPHLNHKIPAHCPLHCPGGWFSQNTPHYLWQTDSPHFIRFHLNKDKQLFSDLHPPRNSRLNLCCFSRLCPSTAWQAALHCGLCSHFSNNPDV